MKSKFILSITLMFLLLTAGNLFAKNAIILSCFGTTEPEAISSIMNIKSKIEKAFPETRVELVFTSNIIRSIWQKRSQSPEEWIAKGIAPEILYVKGILETFGKLQSAKCRDIVVQPTHMFHMEQYSDLVSYVKGIASIKTVRDKWLPFDKIAIGRPAMGTIGIKHPYHDDLKRVVKIFASDIKEARAKNSILVYMGHGNEVWSTGIYSELQKEMRLAYPEVMTFVGCVEGFPSLNDVMAGLTHTNPQSKNILLKPLMIVAGDHARNDMAGEDEDSWKNNFEKRGFKVYPVLKGLGSNNEFVQIFIGHINDAAKEANISLK
ncbi:MAG: sirohydrochlorin cobaltochelatase [Desulfobacterales bacterium]|nr:sirohydrochlorin cobaltochelatase [Desulfobacterales bacterium]